ncbi:threonylcarbamoyl-AMP synthase [Simkania negevensis]|uniref:Threonylcarbamoyl-AMP synthase n=1 Tax=Simkania negevensis TaxID=83561 RepID=A0ABS3ARR0_9BACT|nr:threonylcarbamoyl-AMP synthase [Simkania negevensis]
MRVSLVEAVEILRDGGVVAVPTETVYGIAAKADSEEALATLIALKGRSSTNPMSILIANMADLRQYTNTFPNKFEELISFWPGPLTLAIPLKKTVVSPYIRAGKENVSFRMPGSLILQQIICDCGPIVCPSANRSGRTPALSIEDVQNEFGDRLAVLADEEEGTGIESTVLSFQKERWILIREGVIPVEKIEPMVGYPLQQEAVEEGVISPMCQLSTGKYDPLYPLVLGFEGRDYPGAKKVVVMGPVDQPKIVAKKLFQSLRTVENEDAERIWVDMDFPQQGLFRSIRHRIKQWAESWRPAL